MVEVALVKGANSYCVAMHCRIQRMLAPLAADARAAIASEHHNMNRKS